MPLGASSNEQSDLLRHFFPAASALPAVAWVRKDAALSFELARFGSNREMVEWVYLRLASSLRVVNRDHRLAKVWWLDGHSAKPIGTVAPYGGEFTHSSFVSHSWFVWPESTEGRVLGKNAALGEMTISRGGEEHVLILESRCLDANGHCGQWQGLGECTRNPAYMEQECPRSCGHCDAWAWLYELSLGALHAPLACWAAPVERGAERCAAVETGVRLHGAVSVPGGQVVPPSSWPEGGRRLRSAAELRALPRETLRWLRTAAGAQGAKAFDEAVGDALTSECVDEHNSCAGWADAGECDKNAAFMTASCRRTCGLCPVTAAQRRPPPPPPLPPRQPHSEPTKVPPPLPPPPGRPQSKVKVKIKGAEKTEL